MVIPHDIRAQFLTHGLVPVKHFLSQERVQAAQQAVFSHLETSGIRCEAAWHLDALPISTEPNAGAALVKGLKRCPELITLLGEETHQAVSTLLEGQAFLALSDAQLLFTLPNAAHWAVPHALWHVDLPRVPESDPPGVQVFTFLDTVLPGGGGTLVVAGSHRLANEGRRIRSAEVKKILKREPYFQALFSEHETARPRFLDEPVTVGEITLQVVELCGEPGDVFFADLRLLHTIAPNASRAPRIMLTQRFLLTK